MKFSFSESIENLEFADFHQILTSFLTSGDTKIFSTGDTKIQGNSKVALDQGFLVHIES